MFQICIPFHFFFWNKVCFNQKFPTEYCYLNIFIKFIHEHNLYYSIQNQVVDAHQILWKRIYPRTDFIPNDRLWSDMWYVVSKSLKSRLFSTTSK